MSDLQIDVAPRNGKAQRLVVARWGTDNEHRDTLDSNSASNRQRFLKKLVERGAIGAEEIPTAEKLLLSKADSADAEIAQATQVAKAKTAVPVVEVDVSNICRPEQFILPDVSGVTVPLWTDGGDGLIVRWVMYLRWRDGRRECIPFRKALELSGGKLWLRPAPGDATPSLADGWSRAGREAWLAGNQSPDPANVFRAIVDRIAYYLDFPTEHAHGMAATLALWTMFTYCYQAWPAVPYLDFGGPAGSGKSRAMAILRELVFRPFVSSNVTGPTVFRTLHNQGGALLFDEAEQLRRTNDPSVGETMSVFLAGYKRGGQATRLEAIGDSFKTVAFDVFGPKALACIAGLPPTLASRSIHFTMFRAPSGSEKPRRRIDARPELWQAMRDDLHALALEHGSTWLELADRTDVCPSMAGRDFELWQPLLALVAWLEERGLKGLRDIVQAHALATIEVGRDDATPDADGVLLRLLVEALQAGERPTAGDILDRAKREEDQLFRQWSSQGAGRAFARYGLRPRRYGGRRAFPPETLSALAKVQASYGIELGFDGVDAGETTQTDQTTQERENPRKSGLI